jgi:hypothetical protein
MSVAWPVDRSPEEMLMRVVIVAAKRVTADRPNAPARTVRMHVGDTAMAHPRKRKTKFFSQNEPKNRRF